MNGNEIKQMWDLIIPLLKDSPVFLICSILISFEGVAIQIFIELMLPTKHFNRLKKLPLRKWILFFLGVGWTAMFLCIIVFMKHNTFYITKNDVELCIIPALMISTAFLFLVFIVSIFALSRGKK